MPLLSRQEYNLILRSFDKYEVYMNSKEKELRETLEDKTMNQRATEYDLNNEQFEQLMDKYVMTIVDSMSQEDFRQFVINSYYDDFANYTLSQLLEEIKYTLDDEMLEEFVTEIKGQSEGKNV